MKKILSAFLTLALVMGLAFPALAAVQHGTSDLPVTSGPVDMAVDPNISFQVVYQDEKGNLLGSDAYPAGDMLEFAVSQDGAVPAAVPITVGSDNSCSILANPTSVKINIPDNYTIPGKYNYTIRQTNGKAQGVTYADTVIHVQVLVTNKAQDGGLQKQVTFTAKSGSNKVNSIANTFTVTDGSAEKKFSVKKVVEGNLGDKQAMFDIEVALTKTGLIATDITVGGKDTIKPRDWADNNLTINLQLKHNDEIAINGVPKGVTFTVKENDRHLGKATNNARDAGYQVSYAVNTSPASAGTVSGTESCAVVVTNTKDTGDVAPETGIYLEVLPYVILLAVAVIGLTAFVLKRRANREY